MAWSVKFTVSINCYTKSSSHVNIFIIVLKQDFEGFYKTA